MKSFVVNYSYHELDMHKNNQRVWLEGINIERANFQRGDLFIKVFNTTNSTLILKKVSKEEAERLIAARTIKKSDLGTVSGRTQKNGWVKPIIDICNAKTTSLLKGAGKFRADFYDGEIHFSIHHEEKKRIEREVRAIRNVQSGTIKESSAFTGIGVSTLANHQALKDKGIRSEVLWIAEKEPNYVKIAVHNNPAITAQTRVLIGSVEEVESLLLDETDIFSFSMPCDKQSRHGKAKRGHKAVEDADGATALFGVINMIKASNPAICISENVVDAKTSASYKLLIAEFERLGYKVFEKILDSSHTNSVENRERYWFAAISKGLAGTFDFDNFPTLKPKFNSVGDVLEDIPTSSERYFDEDYFDARQAKNIASGRNFKKNFVTKNDRNVGVIPRNYQKRQIANPHYQDAETGKLRLFTGVEHARLKEIPEELIIGEIEGHVHEGLGQSVDFGQPYGTTLMIADLLIHEASANTMSSTQNRELF